MTLNFAKLFAKIVVFRFCENFREKYIRFLFSRKFSRKIHDIFAKNSPDFRENFRKNLEKISFSQRKFFAKRNFVKFRENCPFSHFHENRKMHFRFNPNTKRPLLICFTKTRLHNLVYVLSLPAIENCFLGLQRAEDF
jgi:hypothetical protein